VSPDRVPRWLSSAAAWSWRLLIVGAVIVVAAIAFSRLQLVVIPFLLAVFLATFLIVPVRLLRRVGFPRALAAATVLLCTVLALAGIAALVEPQIADNATELSEGVSEGVEEIGDWLVEGPLSLSREDLGNRISDNREQIAGGVVSGALAALEVFAGLVLAIFVLFFLLKDGDRMWAWFVDQFAEPRQKVIDGLGRDAWETLGLYFQSVTLAALFDAVLIGIALAVVGVPLVIPLALLTFFAAYFPIIGAFTAGLVAVLVALVSEGFTAALIVLGAIIVVQQVEGNLIYPLVVGQRLRLHPVAVILALTIGGVLAGIVGAFVATPILAVVARTLERARDRRRAEEHPDPNERGQPPDEGELGAAPAAGAAP
jgi:predicted PurR-regulated permease PerM